MLAAAQQQPILFLNANAYDPVPSPDGKLIAYVLTGENPLFASTGRGSLVSDVAFCDANGKTLQSPSVHGFLGEWLPDSSAIVTFRDWRYSLAEPGGVREPGYLLAGRDPDAHFNMTERVAYLSKLNEFVWIEWPDWDSVLNSWAGPIAHFEHELPSLIVPSPDERYLAIGGNGSDDGLWVYDTLQHTLSRFGNVTIHPDPEWSYIMPSWNPWFRDSKHLTFFSGSSLYVASADGKDRHELLKADHGGLAIPSPDGTMIAYATFSPRPMKARKDLSFWAGSVLWVVSSDGGTPRQITKPVSGETYDLRWLTDESLIFDRIEEGNFNEHARIWSVGIRNW